MKTIHMAWKMDNLICVMCPTLVSSQEIVVLESYEWALGLENGRKHLHLPPPPRENSDYHYSGEVLLKLEIDSLLAPIFLHKRSLGMAMDWKGKLSHIRDEQEGVP